MNKLVNKKKIIGIIGGMGPLAGLKLHEYIIKNTKTNGTDQDHLNICHISKSSYITDRTKFLENNNLKNPSHGALQKLHEIYNLNKNNEVIVGVSCNTFHSNKIWSPFIYDSFEKFGNKVNILNMLTETRNYILEKYPEKKNIGVLSTIGTYKSNVYRELLNYDDFKFIEPTSINSINECIYDKNWGIKSTGIPVNNKVKIIIENEIKNQINNGADLILLACTELPFAFEPTESFENTDVPIIDPLKPLSLGLIREYIK